MEQLTNAEEESIALKTIVIVALVSVVAVTISAAIMSSVLGSAPIGDYYTISVLFDAVGFYPAIAVPFLSAEFYQFFTVLVLDGIVRIIIIGFLIASVIELASKINLQSRLSALSARKLRGHVIICGYSSFGERLARDLAKSGKKFVIIEREKGKVDMLRDIGYLAIEGDFTKDSYLNAASIRAAGAAVLDSGSDFEDALAAIAMRRLNKSLKIIVRVNSESSLAKIVDAGADQCIIPEVLAGAEIGVQIARIL
jgi:voltage-gated potassium channel